MIRLNYRDSRPIYEQVKEGIRVLILSGALPEGERLPSVRELSAELAVNPNTIQRAYRELEAEGVVYTAQARGTFAAPAEGLRQRRIEAAFRDLRAAGETLRSLGVSAEAIRAGLEGEA